MGAQTRVTAKTIAEELGLSIATVDRALNNRGNVKEETYRRIMEKSQELNYTPNRFARLFSKNKQFTIAVVFPEYPYHFWELVEIGIRKAKEELQDFGLSVEIIKINEGIESAAESAALVEDLIHSGRFDGMALAAGRDIYVEVIDRAIERGFPICTFNNDSPTSKRLFYVGSDYRSAGRLAAELLCKFIGMNGNVMLVITNQTTFQTKEKIIGFREVIGEYPDVQLWGPIKIDRGDLKRSYDQIKETIASVDGIYIGNAVLSSFAQYLKESNVQRKVALVGHEMTEAIYHFLKQGIVTATITQNPVKQGYYAVKKLFEFLAEEDKGNKTEIITKLEIVTKENAHFYLKD